MQRVHRVVNRVHSVPDFSWYKLSTYFWHFSSDYAQVCTQVRIMIVDFGLHFGTISKHCALPFQAVFGIPKTCAGGY